MEPDPHRIRPETGRAARQAERERVPGQGIRPPWMGDVPFVGGPPVIQGVAEAAPVDEEAVEEEMEEEEEEEEDSDEEDWGWTEEDHERRRLRQEEKEREREREKWEGYAIRRRRFPPLYPYETFKAKPKHQTEPALTPEVTEFEKAYHLNKADDEWAALQPSPKTKEEREKLEIQEALIKKMRKQVPGTVYERPKGTPPAPKRPPPEPWEISDPTKHPGVSQYYDTGRVVSRIISAFKDQNHEQHDVDREVASRIHSMRKDNTPPQPPYNFAVVGEQRRDFEQGMLDGIIARRNGYIDLDQTANNLNRLDDFTRHAELSWYFNGEVYDTMPMWLRFERDPSYLNFRFLLYAATWALQDDSRERFMNVRYNHRYGNVPDDHRWVRMALNEFMFDLGLHDMNIPNYGTLTHDVTVHQVYQFISKLYDESKEMKLKRSEQEVKRILTGRGGRTRF